MSRSKDRRGFRGFHAVIGAFVVFTFASLGLGRSPAEERFSAHYAEFAVAADDVRASEAGAAILAQGGTAADAAAATMLALGVVNPASSGLGGGGFALYYRAHDRSLTFLDFRERAPAAARPDMFAGAEGTEGEGPLAAPSELGGLASGVPGEAAGIDALLARFGSLPRSRVVEPALRLAEEGFTVSERLAAISVPFANQLWRDPVMKRWLDGDAGGLRPGKTLRRPALAAVLRSFAVRGREAIYRGAIAREIVRDNQRAGGILTLRDFADYRVVERKPLEGESFGLRWVTAPPPSAGGYTMLHSLALLDSWSTWWRDRDEVARLHALAESWKGPFLDRQSYFGDPDHVDIPLDELMAEERIARREAVFHQTLAMPPGDFAAPLDAAEPPAAVTPEGGGTAHFCVVDAEGNIASVTTTVNLPFGARYTAAGIVMNDQMDDFAREVGKENAFGLPGGEKNLPSPGRRPVSTMSPTIVFDGDRPTLCIGASGGSRIVTAIEQVALGALVLSRGLTEAVDAPRIHHQGLPNQLRVERVRPLNRTIRDALSARGHAVEPIDNVAVVQAIHLTGDGPRHLTAVSDPRKGGRPAGR